MIRICNSFTGVKEASFLNIIIKSFAAYKVILISITFFVAKYSIILISS